MLVFDTYAIIEIIKGNPDYEPYKKLDIIINNFILAELSYWLIKDYGTEIAKKYINKYKQFIKSLDADLILEAMIFRYKNKKSKLSMTDCISYIMSKKLNIKFLTGDKEFKNMENVEFVK